MPDRLVKHARFARSGVYEYASREIPDLGLPLPPPESIGEKNVYKVYRPANVLSAAVRRNLFTRMPLTRGHPKEWVDPDNFREHVIGYTGDEVHVEYLPDCDEVAVSGTLTMADSVAFDAYEHGITELSPGYRAEFVWSKGEIDGKSYDALMTAVVDTNHCAIVPRGRGGSAAAILDHKEADTNIRKIVSGLWHKARRKLGMVSDEEGRPASQSSGFGPGLRHLVEARATKYPEEIKRDLENVREMADDLPDGDEKALLMRYMDDLSLMKEMKDDSALEAINIVCALYDKLDKAAMEEGTEDKKARDAMAADAKDMCDKCHGSGKIGDENCPTCKGTGKVGAKDETGVKEPPKSDIKEPPKADVKAGPGVEGEIDKPDKEAVHDEPDPSVPAAVPPAPPKPAAAAPAPQPASPSPGGVPVPAQPAAPAPAAPAAGGAAFFMKQLATLLQAMMADPEIKAMAGQAPVAAAPAVPAPAPAAKPAPPQPAAPTPPPGGAPAGKPADEMPSLAATVSPSGGDSAPDEGRSLEGVLNSILNKGKKG